MINIDDLTRDLLDILTSHGGWTGLSQIEARARVERALTNHGVCACAAEDTAERAGTAHLANIKAVVATTLPVIEPVKTVRKPKAK